MGSGPAGPQGVLENNSVCYLERSGAVECEQVTHCVPVHLGLIRAASYLLTRCSCISRVYPVCLFSAFRDPLDMGGDQH